MRNYISFAVCAAVLMPLPSFAVEMWYGASKTKEAPKPAVARPPFATAFVPPGGPVSRPSIGGDYLREMIGADGQTERWAADQLPLRVYIGRGGAGYRPSFENLFVAAMHEWSRASNGRITWTRVSDPQSANLIATWDPNANSIAGEAGNTATRYRMGADGRRYIVFAEIAIMPTNGSNAYSDAEMHKICLHEIGHSLGLHHCSTTGDIMFFRSNPAQISALGPRDASTIQRLYSSTD